MNSTLPTTQKTTTLFTTTLFVLSANQTFNLFKDVRPESYKNPRRIFGGSLASISDFPLVCLLADDFEQPSCTGSIVTPRFILTAAHCIKPYLRHIFYNDRIPKRGNSALVHRIYHHPGFNYKMVATKHGTTIVSLSHDIGLVESREDMRIDLAASVRRKYLYQGLPFEEIAHKKVDVLGFGNEGHPGSPELLLVNLHVFLCYQDSFKYCACAADAEGSGKGVCVGDSGGPVVHNGVVVGVTSLGPPGCTAAMGRDIIYINVFTMVSNYFDILNNTINHKEGDGMTELKLLDAYSMRSTMKSSSYSFVSSNIQMWIGLLIAFKPIK